MRIIRMITIRYTLLSNFVCFILFNAEAQNVETVFQHSITAGVGTRVISDRFMSLSSEKILSIELAYFFESNNIYRKKSITVGWGSGSLKTNGGQLRMNEFSFQYTDAFSILKNKHSRLNSYLGYSIVANPQFMKWGDQYSWTTLNTLSLYNSTVYSWNKNTLSLDLAIPVAGLSSRPGDDLIYEGDVNEMMYNSYSNLNFTSLHNLKAAMISLRYQRSINERLQFQAGASFSYKELRTGPGYLERSYKFHTGLSYRLR